MLRYCRVIEGVLPEFTGSAAEATVSELPVETDGTRVGVSGAVLADYAAHATTLFTQPHTLLQWHLLLSVPPITSRLHLINPQVTQTHAQLNKPVF